LLLSIDEIEKEWEEEKPEKIKKQKSK